MQRAALWATVAPLQTRTTDRRKSLETRALLRALGTLLAFMVSTESARLRISMLARPRLLPDAPLWCDSWLARASPPLAPVPSPCSCHASAVSQPVGVGGSVVALKHVCPRCRSAGKKVCSSGHLRCVLARRYCGTRAALVAGRAATPLGAPGAEQRLHRCGMQAQLPGCAGAEPAPTESPQCQTGPSV